MDFFTDGMRIFLDYIERQTKKNPEYLPHSLIRAFVCAHQAIENMEIGQNSLGVSGSAVSSSSGELYSVVLEKGMDSITVKDIHHLGLDRSVSIEQMISIFRLQMHLDRYIGEEMPSDEVISVLNEIVDSPKFQAVGDRWREARDNFVTALQEGRVCLPDSPSLREDLLSITSDMDWYDYPRNARAIIGSFLRSLDDKDKKIISVTLPKEKTIEKSKVFDLLSSHWMMHYYNIEQSIVDE